MILIEAAPWSAVDGTVQTVRIAGGGSRPYTGYRGFTDWKSGLIDRPLYTTAIGFDESGWTGGAIPQTGVVRFMPSIGATLDTLAALAWDDAPVTIYTADDAAGPPAAWSQELTGTIAAASVKDGILTLTIADLTGKLDNILATGRFAGTGGIEGPAEAEGRIKRRTWGACANIEGFILDKANSIYEFGDPAIPSYAIDAVRDKGKTGVITALGWQGSIAATFTALQGASCPVGGGVVAPSINCAKWWTQPAGPLTADVRGEIGPGYINSAPEIAERISAAIGGPAMTAGTVAAAKAKRPYACGLHVDSDSETAANALDRLLLPVSLVWVLRPAGTIDVLDINLTNPIETLAVQDAERVEVFKAVKSRRIGYLKNHRQQTDGEIAPNVQATDAPTYSDGTPLDALRPAEAGANVTGSHTAAAIQGQGSLATQNSVAWDTQINARPVEFTDGRVAAGLDATGANKIGVKSGVGLPLLTITDLMSMLAGTNLAVNPEFYNGSFAGWSLYNNAGGGKTTTQLLADASAPNSSGVICRVTYDGTGTPSVNPDPGFGGVVQLITDGGGASKPGFYARGTQLIFRVKAKIPVGRTLGFASNQTGSDSILEALSNPAGTGAYQEYLYRVTIGTVGTFSSTGFLFVSGGANSAFQWDIARFDQVDVSSARRQFTGLSFADEAGVARFASDLVTAAGIAASVANQGALATVNAAQWLTQIVGTGKPEDNATIGAIAGVNLLDQSAGSVLALAAIKTILGTAAGITGQGSLALKNTVGASDITVTSLSAIVANLGIITAGLLQSATGSTQLDLNNNRLLFNNGSVMLVAGIGFGSTNQFILWFGPSQANYAACTESNAIFYLKSNGSAYFGGALSAGTLKNGYSTSDISPTASVETAQFGSNGGTITVTLSYAYGAHADFQTNGSGDGGYFDSTIASGPATVDLYRSVGGGAYTKVATLSAGGSYHVYGTRPQGVGEPGHTYQEESLGGSITYTDPQLSTANRQYKAVMTGRSDHLEASIVQNVTIIAVEQ